MNTLMNLKNSDIVALVRENVALFELFDQAYLFGSVLVANKVPNDIDVLLIYIEYSTTIEEKTKHISRSLEKMFGVSVDLIVLSIDEERDTQFLNRISPHYLRLK